MVLSTDWQVRFALTGDLERELEKERKAIKRGVTRGIVRTGKGLQRNTQRDMRASGIKRGKSRAGGQDVFKAISMRRYPKKGNSLATASVVSVPENLEIFLEGGTVTGKAGKYLVLPLPEAEKLGFDRKISRAGRLKKHSNLQAAINQFGNQLRFINIGSNKLMAVIDQNYAKQKGVRVRRSSKGRKFQRDFVPLFLLIKRVRIGRKVNWRRLVREAERDMPRNVEKEIDRAIRQNERRREGSK